MKRLRLIQQDGKNIRGRGKDHCSGNKSIKGGDEMKRSLQGVARAQGGMKITLQESMYKEHTCGEIRI